MSQINIVATPRARTFHAALEGLREQAAALGGPVLLGPVGGLAGLRDGMAFADTLNQREWEYLYGELRRAAPGDAALPDLETLHERARPDEQGGIPIALVCHSYRKPGQQLTRALLKAERDDAEIALPAGASLEDLFETRTAFAASAVLTPAYWGFDRLDDRHRGLTVRFRLSGDFCFADGARPEAVEADFDDGLGFRPLAWDEVQTIDYDVEGDRRVVVRARTAEGDRTASFLFSVGAAAVNWNTSIRVNAKIPYKDRYYDGIAYVYYAHGNNDRRVKRPFLLAEGFPGGNDPNLIYEYFNGRDGRDWNPDSNLADQLRARGYDVIILIFSTRGAAIQANAFVYLRALEFFWEETRNPNAQIVAAGGSMGGLIARYALTYGKHYGKPMGKVARLLTFDSPHRGANLPISIQFTARYFGSHAESTITLLNYPCAQQMLAQQVRGPTGPEDVVKAEYIDFYKELEAMSDNGYPKDIERYAVCNGAADGTALIPPRTHALTGSRGHWPGLNFTAILYTTPNEPLSRRLAIADSRNTDRDYVGIMYVEPTSFFPSRDGVAGGTANHFEQAAAALNPACAFSSIQLHHPRSCFIPAHSALGVNVVGDAYGFKPNQLREGATPFKKWIATATNTSHCTINKAIRDWVLDLHPAQAAEPESLDAAE